jgi:phosphoribosyl 1,2-cyclic phosphodiesterase/ActR/RegA family two-component response regulator
MRVRFWGTRGSVPTPGAKTVRYGGNTSCVEVRAADGTLVILDCGTGAIPLGKHLLSNDAAEPIQGAFLIGHTHWDHIQGFPFFAPLFSPRNRWNVYGPGGLDRQIGKGLAGQMVYEHFPLPLEALEAKIQIQHLAEGTFEIGSIRVTTQYLNHPVFTLGYRLEADGVSVVYATDFEPFFLQSLGASPGRRPVHHEDQRHIRFLEDADLIIHDAQYTLDEFPFKTGWGHMPIECSVDYAVLAGAQRLALFHHDPIRDDATIDRLAACARARSNGHALEVIAAAEGQVIELSAPTVEATSCPLSSASALQIPALDGVRTVLFAASEPALALLLESALQAEGLRVVKARDGATVLKLAKQAQPVIILLDRALPGPDSLAVCRRLRAAHSPPATQIPILILSDAKPRAKDVAAAFTAGATDYLITPLKPTLIRSRVRAWIQRTAG